MKRSPFKPSYTHLKRSGFISPSKVEIVCKVCRKPFIVYLYRRFTARVCSKACNGLALRTAVERVCETCGKVFLINPSQFRYYKGAGKYCSRACSYQGTIKQTAHKPIKDKYGRSGRKVDQDWKKAVRERDQNTCQRCGKVEKYIHTHHVAPRSRRPDLRHDVSNGKCLCNSCHQWVHNHPREATAAGLLSDASYERARKEDYWRRAGNVMITYNGETRCASEWAKVVKIPAGEIRRRCSLGWSPLEVLTKPQRRSPRRAA